MASKYDSFWEKRLNVISDLISQAASRDSSSEADVSELVECGKRESWYGLVDVSSNGTNRGEMVHAGSLGSIIIRFGLIKSYPGMKFRFTISQNLKLQAKRLVDDEQKNEVIVTNKTHVQPGFIQSEVNQFDGNEVVLRLSGVLATLSMDAWHAIVANEPEWQHMMGFLPQYGFGPFAVLIMVTGLNDYQLNQRAETGYWPPIRLMLEKLPPPANCQTLLRYLDPFYRKERLEDQKINRLKTFLDSRLAQELWYGSAKAIAREYLAIWEELARVMRQKMEDKTISFAMKCLGLSLIMAGETGFDASDLPIPVDRRVIFFSERIGLLNSKSPDMIRQAWNVVLAQVRKKNPGVTMIHLDSLIWQIAMTNSEEMIRYFARLQQDEVGKKLAHLALYRSGKPFLDLREQKLSMEPEHILTGREEKIACFIPCCSSKLDSGQIIQPTYHFSEDVLPETWSWLIKGRNMMSNSIEMGSQATSALHLYTGALYRVFAMQKKQIIDLIHSGRLDLYILSAGYGIVHAFEPIQRYDAMLKEGVAVLWRKQHLENIIAEQLIRSKPTHVYGFFAGSRNWYPAASSYRYFYTEGVRTALRQGLTSQAGCFYRKNGLGVQAILGGIGKAFSDLLQSDLNPDYAAGIEEHGLSINAVEVGYERIEV